MELVVIRHAIAVPRGTPGTADEERPLTARGRARFRECARGLAKVVPRPDALLTSPWLRARQTAELAAGAWGGRLAPEPTPALAGGTFDEQARVLDAFDEHSTIAVVGHEPFLSALLARLLAGTEAERLTLKKGGAALVSVPGRLAGGGTLSFLLPPRLLRRL